MALLFTVPNVLWASQPVLQSAVLFSLWRKKLHKEFPVFVTYLFAQIVIVAVLFPVYHLASDRFYFRYWPYLNWGASFLGLSLGFKVLQEIFMDVFRPYYAMKDLGAILFRWGALVMLLVGVVVAASTRVDIPLVDQALVAVQRCVRLAQMGMVLFLISFASHLGIHWRHRSFGLALGFGFFATTELVLYALVLNGRGVVSQGAAVVANMMAYEASILIWIVYCWIASPAVIAASARLKTQRWDRSLNEIQNQQPVDSLIPMFEGMVERALARYPGPTQETPSLEKTTPAGS